jgi:hypothetical protein
MKITTFFLGLLVGGAVLADAAKPPALACNTKAISAEDRPRYKELVGKLRGSISERRELRDGYAFRLTETSITLQEVAEWIRMERLCCPFLVFQVEAKGTGSGLGLTLRGPSGVKAILAEFAK